LQQTRKIVLASASPRRRELLNKTGLKFTVDPSDYPENLNRDLAAGELVKEISLGKARRVASKHPDCLVIAADTLGVVRGKVLGKPRDQAEARRMLAFLSNKSHRVITGFTILDTETNRTITRSIETRVYIKNLTSEEIDNYVAISESLDKAGAYAIQGLGALIVEKIKGDYYNVMGLPLCALTEALKDFGVRTL
jgi:septum formation protein